MPVNTRTGGQGFMQVLQLRLDANQFLVVECVLLGC